MLRITKYGEAVLTQKGSKITEFNEELIDLADEMVDTMYEAQGIGLAAQQIDRAIMLCVVDVAPDEGEIDFSYELDGKKTAGGLNHADGAGKPTDHLEVRRN